MSLPNHKDFPFLILHSVDSTNNYAMGLVHAGMAQQGTAVFAQEQIQGRGQRNRAWISEKDSNIILSIIFDVNAMLPSSRIFLLSKAVALAAVSFFNNYTAGQCSIKWPNDIFWNDRKAGGILIENVFQGSDWKYAIAGIGININQTRFDELQGKAVSLKQITGRDHDPLELARELHQTVMDHYFQLLTDARPIIHNYKQMLYKKDEEVRLKAGNRMFDGIIKDVTDYGELVVAHPLEEKFAVGEIEWIV